MPKRDAGLLIKDMLTAIERIDNYIADQDRASFLKDQKTIDAVVRNLEVLGEATRQLPKEFIQQHTHIQWRLVAGLRNRIVHEYFGLDLEIIWQIISEDLPPVKNQLRNLQTS